MVVCHHPLQGFGKRFLVPVNRHRHNFLQRFWEKRFLVQEQNTAMLGGWCLPIVGRHQLHSHNNGHQYPNRPHPILLAKGTPLKIYENPQTPGHLLQTLLI